MSVTGNTNCHLNAAGEILSRNLTPTLTPNSPFSFPFSIPHLGKGSQEEDEYEEDDFGSSKKQGTSSAPNANKDGKAIDKASAIRSKHSVTEQRRRSKINERFQILRDLIPHSDQKRDTASFLLEVIEYVQYLQEKVQKYEGSYQGWGQEPSKLMPWPLDDKPAKPHAQDILNLEEAIPNVLCTFGSSCKDIFVVAPNKVISIFESGSTPDTSHPRGLFLIQYQRRLMEPVEEQFQSLNLYPLNTIIPTSVVERNSHWRVQSFAGQPTSIKNGLGPVSPFPGKFDESNISISPTMLSGTQNTIDPDQNRDMVNKTAERQPDLASKGIPLPLPMHANMSVPVRSDGVHAHPLQGTVSDAQSTECPTTSELQSQQDELTIEGGTISISSVYSQGLLNNLTQALQSAGLDLSQASISVQINLGKRANKGLSCGTSSPKNHDDPPSNNQTIAHFRDAGSGEDSDQAHKRMKTYK
ncbi:unnamed protein product [Sphenostylis stenocarpa]|uniref:BHLH domain-containing protein n=1 Tax=Sphenostylis stenocarpa TaxID=92480 RepID=A0AA86VEA3_9FABA|nr:unnamed protein product [Sphenostylis stenocarpa]